MADINDLSSLPNFRSDVLQRIDTETNTTKIAPGGICPDNVANLGPALVHGDNSAPTASAYASARHGLRALGESLIAIKAAVDEQSRMLPIPGQILGNRPGAKPILGLMVPPEKAAEVASACDATAMRALANVKRYCDQIDEALTTVKGSLATKMVHPKADRNSVVQQQAEIRAYVSRLPDEKRFGWLQQKIVGNKTTPPDADVAWAVLNSSPWIVGLEPERHAELRDVAEQALAPVEYRRRDGLTKLQGVLRAKTYTFAEEMKRLRPKVAQSDSRAQPALDALKGRAA